jgi:hypothetical protein
MSGAVRGFRWKFANRSWAASRRALFGSLADWHRYGWLACPGSKDRTRRWTAMRGRPGIRPARRRARPGPNSEGKARITEARRRLWTAMRGRPGIRPARRRARSGPVRTAISSVQRLQLVGGGRDPPVLCGALPAQRTISQSFFQMLRFATPGEDDDSTPRWARRPAEGGTLGPTGAWVHERCAAGSSVVRERPVSRSTIKQARVLSYRQVWIEHF